MNTFTALLPASWAHTMVSAALALTAATSGAQTSVPPASKEVSATLGTAGALEQKTERIVHQDRGSRIEELRVGGQTRRIDVDTNSQIPGYQVQPIDPAQAGSGQGSTGKSSWRVIRF